MRRFGQLAIWGLLACGGLLRAQWPDDPNANLLICSRAGEQTLPKAAATSDNGCYVVWQDHASGNYDTYLQRLSFEGAPLWPQNGILISNHPQETWITDYDLAVDRADHAVVVINDIRSGGDRDIYAYRISPDGAFVWGNDGIAISANDGFEPDPRVLITTGGNIVIAWQQDTPAGSVVNLRKLTPAGQDVWQPATITLSSAYGLSIPRIAAGPSDAVFVQYLVHTGTQYWNPKHIYVQKFDSAGTAEWPAGGVAVSTAGGIGPQMRPDLLADSSGSVFSYWYDTRANDHHVFAQRLSAAGAPLWTPNGVPATTAAGRLQMSPAAAVCADSAGTGLMLFYEETNGAQSQRGLSGQRLCAAGQRLWGEQGFAFLPLSGDEFPFNVTAQRQDSGAMVVYKRFTPGSALFSRVYGMRVDVSGAQAWETSPRELCAVISDKGRLAAAPNPQGQVIAVWPDKRSDPDGDVYLQNINPDGTLGEYICVLPPYIVIVAPEDSAVVAAMPLPFELLISNFRVLPDSGDGMIAVRINGLLVEHAAALPVSVAALDEGPNRIELELVTYAGESLERRTADSVLVFYRPSAAGERVIPAAIQLLPPQPNPFNRSVTLSYTLPRAQHVRLTIFDVLGRSVAELVNAPHSAGAHRVFFDGGNLTSGIYIAQWEGGAAVARQKLLLLR